MTDPAFALLLDCLCFAERPKLSQRLADISADEWREAALAARTHAVEPLLHHRLGRLGISLPEETAGHLRIVYQKNMVRNARIYQALNKVLRTLREKDIEAIVMKGGHLADAVYGNFALRPMGDIDLLIKQSDLIQVEEEMLAMGFLPENFHRVVTADNRHFGYKHSSSGLIIEIHWTIQPKGHPFQIDINRLWQRAQTTSLLEAPAMVFAPEDLLLHLCIHAAGHTRHLNLGMLYDISLVTAHFDKELNWQVLGERAREWGALRPVYLILELAGQTLGTATPPEWRADFRPEDFNPTYLETAHEILRNRQAQPDTTLRSPLLGQLWKSRSLKHSLGLMKQRLMPSRETMALSFPAAADSWKIYCYYPVLWKSFLAHIPEMLRLLGGDKAMHTAARELNQVIDLKDWLISAE